MGEFPRRMDGLEINTVDEGFIVYQSDRGRVHYLNHTATLVLELCTGQNSADRIVRLVQTAYGLAAPPETEVRELLVKLKGETLIQ